MICWFCGSPIPGDERFECACRVVMYGDVSRGFLEQDTWNPPRWSTTVVAIDRCRSCRHKHVQVKRAKDLVGMWVAASLMAIPIVMFVGLGPLILLWLILVVVASIGMVCREHADPPGVGARRHPEVRALLTSGWRRGTGPWDRSRSPFGDRARWG